MVIICRKLNNYSDEKFKTKKRNEIRLSPRVKRF